MLKLFTPILRRAYIKYRFESCFFAIATIGLLVRIYCSLDPMLHEWDERYHALVAKNLTDDFLTPTLYKQTLVEFDYKNWAGNGIWLHKQPLSLWMIALSFKLFGVNEIALRLPSVLMSTACICLTFLIAKQIYNAKIGLLAAFFQSVNGLLIETAAGRIATDHVDTAFSFLIELSVFLMLCSQKYRQRHYLFLTSAGVACGLAVLCKWLPALIVVPLYLIWEKNMLNPLRLAKGAIWLLACACLIFIPWQVYAWAHFPKEYAWEQHYNFLHITEAVEGHDHAWWYYLDRIRIMVNELIYLALIWFAARLQPFKQVNNREWFIGAWVLIPLAFFSLVGTKMHGYLNFSFPAYFIILALFTDWLRQKAKAQTAQWLKNALYVVAVFPIILAIRYGIERIKPLKSHEKERAAKNELKQLSLPEKSVIFNVAHPIEVMFYTPYTAYDKMPTPEEIGSISDKGYTIYVVGDANHPKETSERVKTIELRALQEMRR